MKKEKILQKFFFSFFPFLILMLRVLENQICASFFIGCLRIFQETGDFNLFNEFYYYFFRESLWKWFDGKVGRTFK